MSSYSGRRRKRRSQATCGSPGYDGDPSPVALREFVPRHESGIQLVVVIDPNHGEEVEIPGALHRHECPILPWGDGFDFDDVIAKPAIVALGMCPRQLNTEALRHIKLSDSPPQS
jgi:hypothetical protein